MTSATITVFETAIGLAKQAVHQDKAKNYTEAARCYREAISTFHHVKSKSGNQTVSKAIDEKINQYRERLVRIDKYLLSKADLSQLFKSVVVEQQSILNKNKESELENDRKKSRFPDSKLIDVDPHCENNVLQRGLAAIEKGKRRDGTHNYSEALKYYEEGMADLLAVAVDQQEHTPEAADMIKFKCLLIHDRINTICNHLESGAPISDRKDSSLEMIKDESRSGGNHSRHQSGNSNGFDSCSASPEPLLNTTSSSLHPTTTTIAEEYEDDNEDNLMLMEEIRSNLSLASISINTSTTPVNTFVSMETDTFQKSASEAGSRHSLYPMCEIKRSPSLMSGHSDFEMLNGKFVALEDKCNKIPLADLDQELCISSFSLKDGVDRSDGVKSVSMLSSSSSCNSLSKHKYRSFHSSAEDVLAAYAVSSTPGSVKNYSYSEKDRNVSELTYVNTDYIDPVAYKELCLNDSEGSDSGISSDPSPKNSARETSSSVTPTMNANDNNITEELRHDEEETISRTLSEHSLLESQGENKTLLLTVASVYEPNDSEENILPIDNKSNPNPTKQEASVEARPRSVTPPSSQHNINATCLQFNTMPTLDRESKQSRVGENDNENALKFLTPSPPLSRGGSRSSKKSHVSRPEEDELTVLSAEEIVEADGIPTERSKSPKQQVKELQVTDVEVYGKPRAEYVPPRAFARRPNEEEDNDGLNKGCYYFMSCLDAFWIL